MHGHAVVPKKYKDGDVPLGAWVVQLRRNMRELRRCDLGHEPDDGPAYSSEHVSLPISSGRLGLTLRFPAVEEGEGGGGGAGSSKRRLGVIVASVGPACTFKDRVSVGDKLILVDATLHQHINQHLRITGSTEKADGGPAQPAYLSSWRMMHF